MIERGVNRECECEVSIREDPKALPYPSGGERQKTVRHKLSRRRDNGTYTSPGLGDSGERAAPSVLAADLQPSLWREGCHCSGWFGRAPALNDSHRTLQARCRGDPRHEGSM